MEFGFRYLCFICASLLATQMVAADMSGWSDKTVCRLVKAGGGQEHIDEAKSRGLPCDAAVKSASKATIQTSTPTQPGPYPNKSSNADTMLARNYSVFPVNDMICRAVFNVPDTGFKNLSKIQKYVKSTKCTQLWGYDSDFYELSDAPEAGVKIDIDKDGIRDQLLFLYGFQPNTPLRMVAFKLNKEITEPLDLQMDERVSPIDRIFSANEVFANGEYPKIQNARALAVADFNNDGEPDIVIGDGGYDAKPRRHYPNVILMSSPEGFKTINITEARKTHAIAAGDLNGDGYIDILLGRGQLGQGSNMKFDSSRLLINQGDGTFKQNKRSLPRSLMNKKLHQPFQLELIDVDEDGFVDILSGQGCGNYSKIFWNDGSGNFSDQSHTVIPLDYATRNNNTKNAKLGMSHNVKCQRARAHVLQFYVVKEEVTSHRYLGVITTEDNWDGRNLTLHKINARELSEDLKPIDDMSQIYAKNPHEFAYKIDTKDSKTGHVVSVYSYLFDRLSLKFDPLTEKYTRTLNNHRLNRRWKFDAAAIIENAESN
jgi:hypothetical protein